MSLRIAHAGASTRELADRRSLAWTGYGLMGLAAISVLFTLLPHAQAAGIGLVVLLGVASKAAMTALEFKIDTKIAAEKRAIRGAVAEERIGETLDELGEEHLIVHDVRGPFANIDHVIFSRNYGVFLIETKAHGGQVAVVDSRILVNGRSPETDIIAQTLRNTCWLADELERIAGVRTRVNSLVVFTNAFVVTSRSIKGITVTNRKFLLPNIQRLGKPLAPEVWAAREKFAGLLSGSEQLAAASSR